MRRKFVIAGLLLGLTTSLVRAQGVPACVELSPTDPVADSEVTMIARDAAGDAVDLSGFPIIEIGMGEAGFGLNIEDPNAFPIDTSSGNAVFTVTQAMLDSVTFNVFFVLPDEAGDSFIGLADANKPFPFDTTFDAFAAGGTCALPNLPVCYRLSPPDPVDGQEVTVTGIDENGDEIDLSSATLELGLAIGAALPVFPDLSTGVGTFIVTQEMLDSDYFDAFVVIPSVGERHMFIADAGQTVTDVFAAGGNCKDEVPVCLELPTKVAAGQEVAITALNRFGLPIDASGFEIIEIGMGEAGFGLNIDDPNAFPIDTSSGNSVFTITAEMLASPTFNVFILPGEVFFGLADANKPFPFETTADAFAAGGNCDLIDESAGVPACIEIIPTDPNAGDEITIIAFDRDGVEIDLSTVVLMETGWAPAGTNAVFPDLSSGRGVMTVDQDMLDSDYLDVFTVVSGGVDSYFALARFGQRTPFVTVAEAIAAGGNCPQVLVPAGAPACLELSPTNPVGGDEITISALDRDGAPVDMSTLNLVEIGFGEAGAIFDKDGSLTATGNLVATITQEQVDSGRMDFFALLPDGDGRGITLANPEVANAPFESAAAAFANGGDCGDIPIEGLPTCVRLDPVDPVGGDIVSLTAFDYKGNEVDLNTLRNIEIGFGDEAGFILEGDGNLDISSGSAEFEITDAMVESPIFIFFALQLQGEAPIVLAEPGEDTPFTSAAEAFAAGGNCGTGPFIRGDCNADGVCDLSDGVAMLNFAFLGAAAPGCLAACDFNRTGTTDITTAVYFFNAKFAGGPGIPGPNDCDVSLAATDNAVGCETPSCP